MSQDIETIRREMTAGFLLVGKQWRRLVEDALAVHGMSEAKSAPLVWLSRLGGGLRQVELAAYVGVEGPSLVRVLDHLCDAGLLVRKEDTTDRRAKRLWLTPAGADLAARIEIILSDLRQQVFGSLDEADVRATRRVFDLLSAAAGPAGGTQ